MYCRKCKAPIDLNDTNLTCKKCGYDNLNNPENLPIVTEAEAKTSANYVPPYTCPNCGSHNVSTTTVPKLQETPYSPMNALSGMCCFGPLGLLCGLTGGKKVDISEEKVCNDCGTHFK